MAIFDIRNYFRVDYITMLILDINNWISTSKNYNSWYL